MEEINEYYLNKINAIVRTVPLPTTIKGMTVPSDDGAYNIYINSNYTYECQQIALYHELKHIVYNDMYNFDDIALCEMRAKHGTDLLISK